jgi:hypothetical protein
MEAVMPVFLEAIIISIVMLLIFGAAFVAIFLVAITMAPVERSLSKMIWDATAPKRPLPQPPKGGFKDFSSKH